MSKGPNGQKRSTCPAGCKAADPIQTIFPVNQLADAGATGSLASLDRDPVHPLWLRLYAATVPQGRSGDGTTA